MKKEKERYFTDPIYGTIHFPYESVLRLIDHEYVQRLRRITQCGLAHFVYPGANHTRFQHSLGVAHLAHKAVHVLISKGVVIDPKEIEATCLAALLHDIGHGPYSHALELIILSLHHEKISEMIANEINSQWNGGLEMAIEILTGKYRKSFLCQLISSQLDVDRLDYLTRDSFYTGVNEGNVGYDSIINAFNVINGQLVVEEKALHSVENLLVVRHHMYEQIYIHKSVLAIQQMLIMLTQRMEILISCQKMSYLPASLASLLSRNKTYPIDTPALKQYLSLDDIDFMNIIKMGVKDPDYILSFLCKCILHRKIFRIDWISSEKKRYLLESKRQETLLAMGVSEDESAFLVRSGTEISNSYLLEKEIEILTAHNEKRPLSEISHIFFKDMQLAKSFVSYPRLDDSKS